MNKIDPGAHADGGSLRAQVFSELEREILEGGIPAGEAIIESRISEELGVSRTPVREAIRQLELEGLVRTIPNKGAVVIGISKKDIEDIYTIRMHIEGLAARWSAENITESEIGAMREVVDLQSFYVERGETHKVWNLDTHFHEIIHSSCRSNPLWHTLSGFHHYIRMAREISFKTEGRALAAVSEHRRILDAIAARDGDAAEKLAFLHIKNAKENIISGQRAE
jgi:DNA-binding GntR family transcriptional regulator